MKINFKGRSKFILSFFAACIVLIFVLTSILSVRRTLKGSNDFDTFYKAGKAVLTHSGIYYSGEYYQEDKGISPFLYPPAAACFFALFALVPIALAAFLWNAFNLFLFGICCILTHRILGGEPWDRLGAKISIFDRTLAFLALSGVLIDNLTMAQVNLFVFFLCLSSLHLWITQKPVRSGLVLSCAVFMKLTPLLFCFYFLSKRAWKVLAGAALGAILLCVVLPVLFFGVDGTRIYSRQWAGRMIKPHLIALRAHAITDDGHPLKKRAAELRYESLERLLIDKNQSLPALATRLFLKNRNQYAFSTAYPIYSAQRYEWLPVIGGGVRLERLEWIISAIQFASFLLLMLLWLQGPRRFQIPETALEFSIVFVSMCLFSPLTRTHQFIPWLFVYGTMFSSATQQSLPHFHRSLLIGCSRGAALLYFLLASKFGRAAGAGAAANLVLWAGLAGALTVLMRSASQPKKSLEIGRI